jgi:hypothetical protein
MNEDERSRRCGIVGRVPGYHGGVLCRFFENGSTEFDPGVITTALRFMASRQVGTRFIKRYRKDTSRLPAGVSPYAVMDEDGEWDGVEL